MESTSVLRDRLSITLIAVFLLGVASLLPWNIFTTANDYWRYKFRTVNGTESNASEGLALSSSSTLANEGPPDQNKNQRFFGAYLSITSNVVFIFTLGLNTFVSKIVSSNARIVNALLATIVMMIVTMILAKVNTDNEQLLFLGATLVIVALINVMIGFLMGASMGICGYLPSRYMAVCSLGQATGGLICCAAQIGALLVGLGHEDTALLYFGLAVAILTLTLVAYKAMQRTDFYQHYRYLVSISSSTSALELTMTSVPYLEIFRKGWPFQVSSFLVYAVTISFFPGLTVNAVSTHYSRGSMLTDKLFIPLACFTIFNIADCAGRYLFSFMTMSFHRPTLLLTLCLCRVVLVPLFLICNISPANRVHTSVLLNSDVAYILLMILAGASNGYLCTAAFVYAPKTVSIEHQEVSAGMASFFSGFGSAIGSVVSYGVLWLL
ncbi:equilibrative nucleoside transporter 3-like [Tropilaelaps mercedesae]|uniref:Equilibrative nucleoside transporter 3-like n=1 Tax=Tropilaelaps mercedesae TaxID=418985 RepID=A0A1V9XJY7_9ACAR|nr:equilibrative nucleoside transporter 3-like [Tropilaelaps mercedesae]